MVLPTEPISRYFTCVTRSKWGLVLQSRFCRRGSWCCVLTRTRATVLLALFAVFSKMRCRSLTLLISTRSITWALSTWQSMDGCQQWKSMRCANGACSFSLRTRTTVIWQVSYFLCFFLILESFCCEICSHACVKAWSSCFALWLLEMGWSMGCEESQGDVGWKLKIVLRNILLGIWWGALRISFRNFRWRPSWCRSCLTRALCREIGTLPEFGIVAFFFSMVCFWGNNHTKLGSQLKASRTFPRVLPAWIITLDSTLGSRQGTLYKAPRSSERKLQDDNVWTKSDYWNILVCPSSIPLATSKLADIHCFYMC